MPWVADAPHAGFTTGAKPLLPVAATHTPLAVDQQAGDAHSLLGYFTQLLHWRRQQPALLHGSMTLLPLHPQVLGIVREQETEQGTQRLLCVFNFSDNAASLDLPPAWTAAQPLPGSGLSGAQRHADTLHFEPWGGLFLQA
jgi:alpha-glucosidase